MKNIFLSLCFLFVLATTPVLAVEFSDESKLKPGTLINPIKPYEALSRTEVHGDINLSQRFFMPEEEDFGESESAQSLFSYRLESRTDINNFENGFFGTKNHVGKFILRISGQSFLDEDIDNFFDDPLIELNEAFYQDKLEFKGLEVESSWGRIALRRYFDKDEINDDPFDIGERRASYATGNSLFLLNQINEFNDDDLIPFATRDPAGAYGNYFSIRDPDGNSFTDRWGLRRFSGWMKFGDFSDTFYSAFEVFKDWGYKNPGHFDYGFLIAGSDLISGAGDDNSYLMYASWAQRYKKLHGYLKWATLWTNDELNQDVTFNEYRLGATYDINSKNEITSWLALVDLDVVDILLWTNMYRYKFNDHFDVYAALVQRFAETNLDSGRTNDFESSISLHANYIF